MATNFYLTDAVQDMKDLIKIIIDIDAQTIFLNIKYNLFVLILYLLNQRH